LIIYYQFEISFRDLENLLSESSLK